MQSCKKKIHLCLSHRGNHSSDVDDIKQWYKKRGANNVSVVIVDDEHMDNIREIVEKYVFNLRNAKNATDSLMEAKSGKAFHRYPQEIGKFYLRNLAYGMTRQHDPSYRYDWYVFWREDNFLLTPLDIHGAVQQNNGNGDSSSQTAKMFVDEPCRKFETYSDKMYVGNEQAMDLLFGRHFTDYLAFMKAYALSTYVRLLHPNQNPGTQFQPEAFVHDLLLNVDVSEVDMKRVDVRFENDHRCIPHIYFFCMPNHTLTMATKRGIKECE